MDGNFCTLIFLAFNAESVLLPHQQPDAVMHVDEADTGAVLVHPFSLRQNSFSRFLRHPEAVIFNAQVDAVFFCSAGDDDFAAVVNIHVADAVVNRVLQKRLQNQLHCAAVHNVLRKVEFDEKPVFISGFLDIHVHAGFHPGPE